MTENSELRQLLYATWENPVMGDTFRGSPELLGQIVGQLGSIAVITTPELTSYVRMGMPEWSDTEADRVVRQEMLNKMLAFGPALTNGELGEFIEHLSAFTTAIGLMYWGDQTMDRGDPHMLAACELLGHTDRAIISPLIWNRLAALSYIKDKIDFLALPEDAPFVLACFYNQVLCNEARMQRLSQRYLARSKPKRTAFLAEYGAHIAEVSTVSAGLPSVASSLYAIYRQRDPSLPTLAQIHANTSMNEMLQACNVTVRIWDELGDWEMDTGKYPDKGVFVINPLNQYHSSFIGRYCQLADFRPVQVSALQQAFASFHNTPEERQMHSEFILETFRQHIHDYMTAIDKRLPPDLREQFGQYITLCKRVLEIGYVNRIGDIALASPGLKAEQHDD